MCWHHFGSSWWYPLVTIWRGNNWVSFFILANHAWMLKKNKVFCSPFYIPRQIFWLIEDKWLIFVAFSFPSLTFKSFLFKITKYFYNLEKIECINSQFVADESIFPPSPYVFYSASQNSDFVNWIHSSLNRIWAWKALSIWFCL